MLRSVMRHMPRPLDYINLQVIQSLTLLGLVAGYRSARFDQVAIGGSGVAAPPPPAPLPATDAGAPPAASGTAAAPKAGQ